MKKWYVYELFNLVGTIEYVGYTNNPKRRLNQHLSKPSSRSGHSKFYGRSDIQMNVVKEFDNKKETLIEEAFLQKYYGLKTTVELLSVPKINKTYVKSTEHREKLRLANLGKPKSEEHKQKIREAAIRRYSTTNT